MAGPRPLYPYAMTQPPAGPPYPYQPPAAPPPPFQPPAGQQPPPYPSPSPGYYEPAAPQAQSTSGFAVASVILGIIGAILLSIPFGIVALGKTKPGGQKGRGMAIAGLAISAVWAVAGALIIVLAVVGVVAWGTHSKSARNAAVGDCWAELPTGNRVSRVNTTSCDRPHRGEVVGVLAMPDGSYPAQSVFQNYKQKCRDALASYSSTAMNDSRVDLAVMPPSEDSWKQGDREMVCIATFSSGRTGSIKG
jgi:Septum formation